MKITRALALLAPLTLLLVPLGSSATTTVSATGVIAGSGTSYTLTVKNTGTEAIKCMQLFVASGVRVGTVTPPGGWIAGVDATTRARLGAQSQTGIAPGASATFAFTTEAAYPDGGGGELHVSANCQTDVVSRATGPGGTPPPPPPPPPPPGKKCACSSITVKIDPTLLRKKNVPADKQDFGVGFSWTMKCTAGAGGCTGKVEFLAPKILAGSLPKPKANFMLNIKSKKLTCAGPCNASTTKRFEIKMKSTGQLNELFGRTLAYQVRTWCIVNGVPIPKGTTTIKVRVDQQGRMRPA